jgi:drug/metabolite transporter (DMT)-like permease
MQDPWTHQTNWPRIIGVTLLVIGVLAIIAGVIYLTVPAHSLPSIMGRLSKADVHRSKRGVAALVVGICLGAVGGILVARSRRPT